MHIVFPFGGCAVTFPAGPLFIRELRCRSYLGTLLASIGVSRFGALGVPNALGGTSCPGLHVVLIRAIDLRGGTRKEKMRVA